MQKTSWNIKKYVEKMKILRKVIDKAEQMY